MYLLLMLLYGTVTTYIPFAGFSKFPSLCHIYKLYIMYCCILSLSKIDWLLGPKRKRVLCVYFGVCQVSQGLSKGTFNSSFLTEHTLILLEKSIQASVLLLKHVDSTQQVLCRLCFFWKCPGSVALLSHLQKNVYWGKCLWLNKIQIVLICCSQIMQLFVFPCVLRKSQTFPRSVLKKGLIKGWWDVNHSRPGTTSVLLNGVVCCKSPTG